MKRTVYHNLIATARKCGSGRPHTITATWTWQPDDVPVWSPGPDWVELKSACLWARQSQDADKPGLDVIVLTSPLNEAGDDLRKAEALLYAFLPEGGAGIASVSDKHHKIHTYAAEGSVKTLVEFAKPGEPTHPAEWYWRYMEGTRELFKRVVRSAGHPRWPDLWQFDVERTPHGSMLLSFEVELSRYRTHADPGTDRREFWWDAARYPDLIAAVSVFFDVRVRLSAGAHCRDVGDPLWQAGIAVLYPDRPRRKRHRKRHKVTVTIKNSYACGRTSGGEYQVHAPPADPDEDEMIEWWQCEAHPLTGDGHPCGATEPSVCELAITSAPGRPELIGQEWSVQDS